MGAGWCRPPIFKLMILTANRQIYRGRVLIAEGQRFEAPDNEGRDLVYRGLAHPHYNGTYETKVVIPAPPPTPVVVPQFFRDLYMPDAGIAPEVSAASDTVLPAPDAPTEGTIDPPRRKRGRPRKYPAP